MYARAAKAYKRTELNSASKAYILDSLYERLGRDFDEAKDAIYAENLSARSVAIDHASRIVTELKAALDFSVSKDLCENLNALYSFVEDCMESAIAKNDPQALADAKSVVENLRASFAEAAANADNTGY